MEFVLQKKYPGDKIMMDVWRDGEEIQLWTTLKPVKHTVPVFQYDKPSSYFIFCGVVFTVLSQPLLHTWGDEWYNNSPRRLCYQAMLGEVSKESQQQIVVISSVLPTQANMGTQRFTHSIVQQ